MSIISEISSFIIIIFGLLAAIISVLEGESRRRIIMFVILIGVILLLICWELYRIEDNCVRQKEDSMRPVVEKLDEILELMKTGAASSSEKTPPSGRKAKEKKKPPSDQPSDTSSLQEKQAERLASLERSVERLEKELKTMKDEKLPLSNFSYFIQDNEPIRIAQSSQNIKPSSPKPVKTPRLRKPAKLNAISQNSIPKSTKTALPVQSAYAPTGHEYTSRLCLNGKKATHMPSIQTMIRLLRISKTGEKADFDITLPNSYVRRMADMEEGTRRPFESNRKAYFFELVQLRTGCADVAVDERKIELPQVRIQ